MPSRAKRNSILGYGACPKMTIANSAAEAPLTHSRYFATCARGIEPVLADELRALAADAVEPGRGGVQFAGGRALLYRANLWLRTAIRVLMPVLEATVTSPEELYDAVRSVDWSHYLTPEHTL